MSKVEYPDVEQCIQGRAPKTESIAVTAKTVLTSENQMDVSPKDNTFTKTDDIENNQVRGFTPTDSPSSSGSSGNVFDCEFSNAVKKLMHKKTVIISKIGRMEKRLGAMRQELKGEEDVLASLYRAKDQYMKLIDCLTWNHDIQGGVQIEGASAKQNQHRTPDKTS